jgi:hypothetical protein
MAPETKGSPKPWQPETAKSQAETEPKKSPRNNTLMPRKDVIKIVLSKEQHEILKRLAQRLGISESETMRTAFMEYAKNLSLISEYIKTNFKA